MIVNLLHKNIYIALQNIRSKYLNNRILLYQLYNKENCTSLYIIHFFALYATDIYV